MDLRTAARAGIVTGLMVGLLACAGAAPAAAAAPGRTFFGMQSWTLPNAQDFAVMERGRVGTFRAVFDGSLASSPEPARWEPYDALLTAAARARIEVLPVLLGLPGPVRINRPRTRAAWNAWASFVTAVAARYGRGGTFWEAHPELNPMPLTHYQVWNEPNLRVYWRPARDAAGYLRLVRLTRARLRAVDPRAMIVLAGLPDSKLGMPMLSYVRSIYEQPGARNLFDVVAVHPYADDAPGILEKLNRLRASMDRRGDRRTKIWVTEGGWGTGGVRSTLMTSRVGQATRVTRTFRALLAARGRLRLGRVVLCCLQDRAYHASERPWWAPRAGLFDLAGNPKFAWRTFVGFTGGRPGGRLTSVAGRGPGTPPVG